MDNDEARFLLGSYRPNGADAHDPAMAAALQQAACDPALAREFAEQQAFDEGMIRALQHLRGPEAGGATIASMRQSASRTPRRWWPFGLAAALAVAALIGMSWPRADALAVSATATWPELAAELTAHHLRLEAHSRDAGVLTMWLREHDAPMPALIPSGLARLPTIGCQKWTTSRGKVALICFRNDHGQTLHLLIFADAAAAATMPALGAAQVVQSDAWTFAQWRDGDCVCVLAVPSEETDPARAVRAYLRT